MHVAFNQDASCCVAGTAHGFRVYNCSPFGKFYTSNEAVGIDGVGLAQMLFSTSLIVLVGNGEHDSPRKLSIVNTRRTGPNAVICELTFPTAVRSVRLNRQRLVVVLDTQIYLYNIANMKLLYTLDTVVNRGGVADITPQVPSDNAGAKDVANWLVYPAGPPLKHHVAPPVSAGEAPRAPQGDAVVFDADELAPVAVVRAHRSPLAAMALNEDGTLLATTSDRGTLIRVFAIPSGTLLYEFRRGSYQSKVYSLAFSLGSKLLCVSSATQTVHIYKLEASQLVRQKHADDSMIDDDAGLRDEGDPDGEEADQSASPEPSGPLGASLGGSLGGSTAGSAADSAADSAAGSVGGSLVGSAGGSLGAGATGGLPGGSLSGSVADPSATAAKAKSKSKSKWFSRAWGDATHRGFAWFKLPLKHNTRTSLGLAPLSNMIYVASETGKLFHYAVDLEKGGECRKVAEFTLD